jgi:hypothetical protein
MLSALSVLSALFFYTLGYLTGCLAEQVRAAERALDESYERLDNAARKGRDDG